MSAVVVTERRDGVLVISLDRPGSRNAINLEVAAALGDALEELSDDADLRVAVLRSTSDVFCAGQDLKALAAGESILLPDHPDWGWAGWVAHFVDKPIIAAVGGAAFGGGFELALACDLIVASDRARFALPEVQRSLIAAGGGLPRIAQQIPQKAAARLVYTGEAIDAEQALAWGLVTEVVEQSELDRAAFSLAERIAACAPLAVRASKRVLAAVAADPMWRGDALRTVADEFDALAASADASEAFAAFAAKRPAVWRGR